VKIDTGICRVANDSRGHSVPSKLRARIKSYFSKIKIKNSNKKTHPPRTNLQRSQARQTSAHVRSTDGGSCLKMSSRISSESCVQGELPAVADEAETAVRDCIRSGETRSMAADGAAAAAGATAAGRAGCTAVVRNEAGDDAAPLATFTRRATDIFFGGKSSGAHFFYAGGAGAKSPSFAAARAVILFLALGLLFKPFWKPGQQKKTAMVLESSAPLRVVRRVLRLRRQIS
jgi:hypothetical protein